MAIVLAVWTVSEQVSTILSMKTYNRTWVLKAHLDPLAVTLRILWAGDRRVFKARGR